MAGGGSVALKHLLLSKFHLRSYLIAQHHLILYLYSLHLSDTDVALDVPVPNEEEERNMKRKYKSTGHPPRSQ